GFEFCRARANPIKTNLAEQLLEVQRYFPDRTTQRQTRRNCHAPEKVLKTSASFDDRGSDFVGASPCARIFVQDDIEGRTARKKIIYKRRLIPRRQISTNLVRAIVRCARSEQDDQPSRHLRSSRSRPAGSRAPGSRRR